MQTQHFSIKPFHIPDWPEVIESWRAQYNDATVAFNCVRVADGSFIAITWIRVGVWIERPGRTGRFVPFYEMTDDRKINRVRYYGGPVITPNGSVKRRSTTQRKTTRCHVSAALYVDPQGNSSWTGWIGSYDSVEVFEDGESVEFDEIPPLPQEKIIQQMRLLAARRLMGYENALRWVITAMSRKH